MKVVWTKQAIFRLQEIYTFYKELENTTVAQHIKNKILLASGKLKNKSILRKEEELLKPLNQQHRFLISGNYKIIYLTKAEAIYVTDVFDTRQNPEKMIHRNK